MVLKTATCRFSGLRIYPGKGIIYVRVDGNQFLFMNQKCKSLFQQRKRPAKIAWTVTYRKQHKKDQEAQIARKKRRTTARTQARSIAGVSLEVIQKKRAEKPEVRKASREAALREVKERLKKTRQDKAVLKAADAKKGGSKAPKSAPARAVAKGARR